MDEILIGFGIVWLMGILFYAPYIARRLNESEDAQDYLEELGPIGILVTASAIVFWPAFFLVSLIMPDKR